MKDEWPIIEKILAGDVSAFEQIVLEYRPHVLKIVCNMVSGQDVEEVAQEAFVRAYKDLAGYRRKAPFQHWLSKVTVRASYDHWRKQRRQRVQPVSDEELGMLEQEFAALRASEKDAVDRAKELLDWALGHLSPEDRLAFSLLYLEDLSMKEVGETLGWSVARVKMRSFRARHALRKLLKERLAA